MTAIDPQDPYRTRGYAPVAVEHDDVPLRIEGTWPTGLAGTFYRVGPNPRFAPRGPYNPLNADGMVHAIRVRDGRATYANRWVRTRRWHLEDAAGRALFGTSGNPADDDPAVAGAHTDGVANTSLLWHAGRLLALEEGNAPIEVHPRTLATLGVHDFGGRLPRNMTAHPKLDPATGELVLIANFERRRFDGVASVHQFDACGTWLRSAHVDGPQASLMHDFALTRDFVLLLYCSVTVSVARLRAGGPPLAFEPGLGTRVGVLPRHGDAADVRWFHAPACMAWHVVNAWNDGNRIVLDLCQQDSPMFARADGTPPDHLAARQLATRWCLSWDRPGIVTCSTLLDVPSEYPRIDERFVAARHRHAWFATDGGPGTPDVFQRGLVHLDVGADGMARDVDHWRAPFGHALAEPVFVPRDPDAPEGEGYVLTNIYDEARDASHLAVFDARDIAHGPLARAHLDLRVPVGFHGCWIDGT